MFLNFTVLPWKNEILINANDIVSAEELFHDSIAHLYDDFRSCFGTAGLEDLPENVMRLTLRNGQMHHVELNPTHFKQIIANLK